jgi:methionyl-tRNA formyltransferase
MLFDSIARVHDAGHKIVLIGTCTAAPEYDISESDFAILSKKLDCPFFVDTRIDRAQHINLIKATAPDIAISVNWLTLIGQEVLDLFPQGIINAHAGDLPRYRGNACPNWAILAGEDKVVATLHKMTPELDGGPVLAKCSFPLTPRTYIGDVYRFLHTEIPRMFVEVLDGLASDRIQPRPQSQEASLSLRCFPRYPQDSEIKWSRSADQLARLVRASAEPFNGAYTFLGRERLTVWRAYPDRLPYPYLGTPGQVAEVRRTRKEVVVICGDGVLVLEEVQTATAGRRPASEIISSARARLGLNLGEELSDILKRLQRLESLLSNKRN